jgi:hypothetical protein
MVSGLERPLYLRRNLNLFCRKTKLADQQLKLADIENLKKPASTSLTGSSKTALTANDTENTQNRVVTGSCTSPKNWKNIKRINDEKYNLYDLSRGNYPYSPVDASNEVADSDKNTGELQATLLKTYVFPRSTYTGLLEQST